MIDLILTYGGKVASIVTCILFVMIKYNDLPHMSKDIKDLIKTVYELKGKVEK